MIKSAKYKKDVTLEQFLFWAYQQQKVHIVADNGVGLNELERRADGIDIPNVSRCGVAQMQEYGRIGARCDYQGKGIALVHPDAELIHDLIKSKVFTHLERGLIMDYAVTGMEPDPMLKARTKIVPDRKQNGRIKTIKNRNNKPVASLIKILNHPDRIEFARDTYAIWWVSMDKLFKSLQAKASVITSYNIRSFDKSPAPWV